MCDTRIVECPYCDSGYMDDERCLNCNGTGEEEIEAPLITLEELDEIAIDAQLT